MKVSVCFTLKLSFSTISLKHSFYYRHCLYRLRLSIQKSVNFFKPFWRGLFVYLTDFTSYVSLVARKLTKYTDKNSKSLSAFKRHAAVPSANRESVWKTYVTAWPSRFSPGRCSVSANSGSAVDVVTLVVLSPQVSANMWWCGGKPNRRSHGTNQRKRTCVLWHGSISAKEKRVSATFAVTPRLTRQTSLFAPVFLSFQAVLEFGVGQRECNSSQQPGKVCLTLKLTGNQIHVSSVLFLQIRLQGRIWKVQAVHDDNPDVWSNNLPLLPQLSVGTGRQIKSRPL